MNTLLPFMNGADGLRNEARQGSGTGGPTRSEEAAEQPFLELLERGRTRRSETVGDEPSNDSGRDRSRASGRTSSRDPAPDNGSAVPGTLPVAGWGPLSLLQGLASGSSAGLQLAGVSPGQNVVPADLTQQIMARIQNFAAEYAEGSGPSTLTLKLSPEHLGFLQVDLTPQGNLLKVAMTAASPEAEAVLKEDLNRLSEALLNRVGRFQQVEVRVELKPSGSEDDAGRDGRDGRSPRDRNGREPDQEQQSHGDPDQASGAMGSDGTRTEG